MARAPSTGKICLVTPNEYSPNPTLGYDSELAFDLIAVTTAWVQFKLQNAGTKILAPSVTAAAIVPV